MPSVMFVISFCVLVCIESTFGQTSCETTNELGRITESNKLAPRQAISTKCWTIRVPAEKYARIEVTSLTVEKPDFADVTLTIGSQTLKPPQTRFPTFSLSDTNITFSAVNSRNPAIITVVLQLSYTVESLACARDAFRCNETECIPRTQVCNGVRNCGNGADERDCGSENEATNLKESRMKTLQFLKSLEFRRGGWGDDNAEVLTAIHLANNTNFNVDIAERLVATTLQLQISSDSDPGPKKSAQYINALQATCLDPKNFFGKDLVDTLHGKTKDVNFSDSIAFLALCKAKIDLKDQIDKIKKPVQDKKNFDEAKYYSALTIACMNRSVVENRQEVDTAMQELRTEINRLKALQRRDGSFDTSVTISAWILQIIMASNITDGDWSYQDAIGYLVKEMEKNPKDISALVATLPLLANKTLIDVKCNDGSRKEVVVRENELRKTISLRYEESKVFSRIVKVQENITAFQFLELAAKQDSRLSFRARLVDDKINVYEIADVADDPTSGKYWQFYYITEANETVEFLADEPKHAETKLQEGLDELMMTDVKELILWYKTSEVKNEDDVN